MHSALMSLKHIFLERAAKRSPAATWTAEDRSVVDGFIAAFAGKRFATLPPDPRVIDVARMRSLRERLADRFHYRWRQHEADAELVEALFDTKVDNQGGRWQLSVGTEMLNERGDLPQIWVDHASGHSNVESGPGFRRYFYITAASATVARYISDFECAERLIWTVLPKRDLTLHSINDVYRAKLGQGEQEGPWIEGKTAALALVSALLEHLERKPHEAAHWRSAIIE